MTITLTDQQKELGKRYGLTEEQMIARIEASMVPPEPIEPEKAPEPVTLEPTGSELPTSVEPESVPLPSSGPPADIHTTLDETPTAKAKALDACWACGTNYAKEDHVCTGCGRPRTS